jgi:hypothetical protein
MGLGVTLVMGLLLILMPGKVAGQDQGGPEPTSSGDADVENTSLVPGRPTVRPTRTDTPPDIDGRLDDEAWKTAALITEFVQQSPLDGAPATEETEVYIAYDADNLYFAFYAHYEDPSIMRANRVDRDRAMMDDLMTVYFDTFMDQQGGYDFDVNAYGVQGDGTISGGGFFGGRGGRGGGGMGSGGRIPSADRSWNALFETGAQIVEDGFTAEMAIPFKSLRYPSRARDEAHRWGFQIVREVKGKDQENQVWAPMSRDESSFLAQMGVLDGMINLSTSRNIEVLPTFTAIRYGAIDPTVPAFVHLDTDPDAGVNIKYGVTSNLTADFTVNPDFSQIESDRTQIEVNQRFPIRYPELRPFFVEGAEIFNFIGPVTLVHTRTIVDPDYGAKLTGKVGNLSIGMLAANDRAPGTVEDELDPAFGQHANTVIGRARYDLYAESNIGTIFTDREFLDGYSRLVGVDGNFRLNRTTTVGGRAIRTWLQDPGGVERTGRLMDVNIRNNGRNLSWFLASYQLSPDFGTDVGFVRRTDEQRVIGNISYRFWPEGRVINWGPRVMISRNWDFDRAIQNRGLGLGLNFSFARNITFSADVNRDMERFLGTKFEKTRFSVRGNVNTSRSFSFGGNVRVGDQILFSADPTLGHQVAWSVNAQVRPTSSISSRLNLSTTRLTIGGIEEFDVKILRGTTTYQITEKLGLRNITEFNSLDKEFDLNLLATYRIDAGTVFFVGYDDHYQQADLIEGDLDGNGIDEQLFFTGNLRRTNRAIFMKLQYLLRY